MGSPLGVLVGLASGAVDGRGRHDAGPLLPAHQSVYGPQNRPLLGVTVPETPAQTIRPWNGTDRASSRLDTEEISYQPTNNPPFGRERVPPSLDPVVFRHTGWHRHRYHVYRALDASACPDKRLARFANCGSDAYVYEHPDHPGSYRVHSLRCHDRFCVPCRRELARTVAQNVVAHARDTQLRFLTLTLKHSDATLSDQLDLLYTSFRRLRNVAAIRPQLVGGVAFLEIKRSRDLLHWHPHLHVLYQGSYIPKSQLAHAWHRITLTSYIVDVRSVTNNEHAARYVTKYAGKPLAPSVFQSSAHAQAAILALWHRRLMFAFGTWRGLKLTAREAPEQWRPVAPLFELLEKASHGDAFALFVIRSIRRQPSWQPPTTEPSYARPPPLQL